MKLFMAIAGLAAGLASAGGPLGYSDNSCNLQSVDFAWVDVSAFPEGGNPSAQSELTRTYHFLCQDNTHLDFPLTSTIPFIISGATYNIANYTYNLTGVYYGPDEYGRFFNENGNWYTWPTSSQTEESAVLHNNVIAFWKPPKAATTYTWSAKTQVTNSINTFAKYNPSKFAVSQLYPNRYKAFPIVNGADDARPEYSARAFARVDYMPDGVHREGNYFATVYCFPGKGDADDMNRPLVVSDAFDAFNERSGTDIYRGVRFNQLVTGATSPREKGYDVFFLDFAQGGGDILVNASLTLSFLQWLQGQTSAKIIVGGPSMGGIITRTALLYGKPGNNTLSNANLVPNVKGYLSIDSPHQGASIGASLQTSVYGLSQDDRVDVALELADMAGATMEDDAAKGWKEMNVPAAHQMLYEHFYPGSGSISTGSHDAFYDFLASLGKYNANFPSVAIAYSNFFIPHNGININQSTLAGTIEVPICAYVGPICFGQVVEYGFYAGNYPVRPKEIYELYPGSACTFYYKNFVRSAPKFFHPKTLNGEIYKGTFIPINSALDLSGSFDVFHPATQDETQLASYSPFQKVFYMNKTYNEYHKLNGLAISETINDKRYNHMVFDEQLMEKINNSLQYLDQKSAAKSLPPIMALLLN